MANYSIIGALVAFTAGCRDIVSGSYGYLMASLRFSNQQRTGPENILERNMNMQPLKTAGPRKVHLTRKCPDYKH